MEVQELPPGRSTVSSVASYVRAVLKARALRRALAEAVLEVERRKQTFNSRSHPEALLAQAQMLLEELGIEAGKDAPSGT